MSATTPLLRTTPQPRDWTIAGIGIALFLIGAVFLIWGMVNLMSEPEPNEEPSTTTNVVLIFLGLMLVVGGALMIYKSKD